MKKRWWYRCGFLVSLIILSLFVLIPTIMDLGDDDTYPIHSKINLGLDLQGGLYMVLGIDFKKVYRDEIKVYGEKLQQYLEDQEIFTEILPIDIADPLDPKQRLQLKDPLQISQAIEQFKKSGMGGRILRLTSAKVDHLEISLRKVEKRKIETQSIGKSIEVIRNRIDEFGVMEPEILSQGNDRIIIQLPGIKDVKKAKDLIGQTAKLEFKIIDNTISRITLESWVQKGRDAGIDYSEGEKFSRYLDELNLFLKKDLPKGFELAFEKTSGSVTGKNVSFVRVPYLIEDHTLLTGESLSDARLSFVQDGTNKPYVAIVFTSEGQKIFSKITEENVGKQMAIVLDGNIYSAPLINEKISSRNAQITLGNRSFKALTEEGKTLALILRAGALPVQLDFLEQRIVGPSLGKDSIKKAKWASLIGCSLIFIFIIFYYKFSGFITMITLALNLLFVLACLVAFGATLTLPGIAGMALTIGMAVDANIIIYERIREEIKAGLNYYQAIQNGFERALLTIMDANITTALAGLCLLNFGIGPVRGFAVTLLIGILATLYTSYFVLKLFFELYIYRLQGQKISI